MKNDSDALPLAKDAKRIHVAGKSADDIGNQCGGWTIQWQGESGDITEGTTILEAIQDTVADGTKVTFNKDGSGAKGADVGVLVIGEPPYAEGNGDTAELALAAEDVAAFKNMKAAGIPVVVVLVSGTAAHARTDLGRCGRDRRRLAPGHRRPGRRRRAIRRLRSHGQALFHLAEVGETDSDQRWRRKVRSAVRH